MGKISQLSDQKVEEIKQNTPFDDKDVERLMKRYSLYDKSKDGREGIPYDVIARFPEFRLNALVPRVLELYMEEDRKVYPEKFLYMAAALDPRTDIERKRQLAFRCVDVHEQGHVQHDEMFRFYKLHYRAAISNDQVLDLTFRAMDLPDLANPEDIGYEDFAQLVSDAEIRQKFTVILQQGK